MNAAPAGPPGTTAAPSRLRLRRSDRLRFQNGHRRDRNLRIHVQARMAGGLGQPRVPFVWSPLFEAETETPRRRLIQIQDWIRIPGNPGGSPFAIHQPVSFRDTAVPVEDRSEGDQDDPIITPVAPGLSGRARFRAQLMAALKSRRIREGDTREIFRQMAMLTEWDLAIKADNQQIEGAEKAVRRAQNKFDSLAQQILQHRANPNLNPNFDLARVQGEALNASDILGDATDTWVALRDQKEQRVFNSRVANVKRLQRRRMNRAIEKQELFSNQNLTKQDRLGRGAFGSVFRVRRPDPNAGANAQRDAVLKLGHIRNLSKEMQWLVRLRTFQHPNIVQIYPNVHHPRGNKYMAFDLELASSGDLGSYINQAGLYRYSAIPEPVAWDLAIQMFRGLTFLHTGRIGANTAAPPNWIPIVHQDIKEKNILVVFDPNARNYFRLMIADFGLAEFYAGPHADQTLDMRPGVGAPGNTVAPEYPLSTPALDVWSMGQTLHRLLTGCSARLKTRWLNETGKKPHPSACPNVILAMNLQPLDIQPIHRTVANRFAVRPDNRLRFRAQTVYSVVLSCHLYHMLGFVNVGPQNMRRRRADEILNQMEMDWATIDALMRPPVPAVPPLVAPLPPPATVMAAVIILPQFVPRFGDVQRFWNDHLTIRNAALASNRSDPAAYRQQFENRYPGETLATPKFRDAPFRPGTDVIMDEAGKATEGVNRERDMRAEFRRLSSEEILQTIQNGADSWRVKLEKLLWLRRRENLEPEDEGDGNA